MDVAEKGVCRRLTPREAEVLNALANGLSSKEIAKELSVAPRTIEVYIERLRFKLNARNRAHMTAIGVNMGLVT